MSITDDAALALSLQRELNALPRRSRTQRSPTHGFSSPPDLLHARKESSKHAASMSGGTVAKRKAHGGNEEPCAKKQRVGSRPMVFHEALGLWFRAQVTHRRPDGGVKVAWDGKDDWKPEWLSCSSDRIWKGSMRNKDWKYVSNGGWLPKEKASRRAAAVKSPQNPATPPLASPHQSCSETEGSSDLEETAQKIEFQSPQRKLPAATWASVKREAKGGLPVKLLLKRMVKASHAM